MIYISLLLVMAFFGNAFAQPIEIRPATEQDIPAILELDRRVTYEFFKPLYAAVYQKLNVTRDVDADLEEELAGDEDDFPNYVTHERAEHLQIAWDAGNDKPCGLMVFTEQDDNGIFLELLLVDKDYRGQGVGKKLVRSILQLFKATKTMKVTPIQHGNENTLKFYESLGFKNLGKDAEDKINSHGIRHSDMYYHFRWDISAHE